MRQKKVLLFLSVLLLLGSGFSCSPESPKLYIPPKDTIEQADVKGSAVDSAPLVDILFVVDRSQSMDAIQKNLSSNIDLFLKGLVSANVDYHIGVITSDGQLFNGQKEPGCWFACVKYPNTHGVLQGDTPFVTPTTPNGISILKKNILVGTQGDTTEQFFDPIVKALSPEMTAVGQKNYGFLRDNAYLAVVFITDADDQSKNSTYGQTYDFLVNLKKSRNKVLSYGIIIPSSLGSTLPAGCSRDIEPMPVKLERFLELTPNNKSNRMNLCSPQFGTQLTQFSNDLVRYLVGKISLDKIPIISSIRVYYGGKELPPGVVAGWYYDPRQNAVIIGDKFIIDDEGDGSGFIVKFDAIELN